MKAWRLAAALALLILMAPAALAQRGEREFVRADRVTDLLRQLPTADDAGKAAILSYFREVANKPSDPFGDAAMQQFAVQVALRNAGPEIAKVAGSQNAGLRRQALAALGETRARGEVIAPVWTTALAENEPEVDLAISEGLVAYLRRSALARNNLDVSAMLALLDATVTDLNEIAFLLPRLQRSRSEQARRNTYEAVTSFFDFLDTIQLDRANENPAAFASFKRNLPLLPARLADFFRQAGLALPTAGPEEVRVILNVVEQAVELAVGREELVMFQVLGRPEGRLLREDLAPQGKETADAIIKEVEPLLPIVANQLQARAVATRLAACNALEAAGDIAAPELAAIQAASRDPNVFVRWSATRILGKLRLEEDRAVASTVAALMARLADPDLAVRGIAALAIERFGPKAAPAVPALSDLAKRPDAALQLAAVRALAAVGPAAKGGLPGLAAALKSQDERVRELVPPILGDLGRDALPAVPALQEALTDSSASVRLRAAEALVRINVPGKATEVLRPAP